MKAKMCWSEPNGFTGNKSLELDSGLLAPNGVFYGCGYAEHSGLAFDLEIPQADYEGYGFMHVRDGVWSDPECVPTQAQKDTIFDWCTLHHRKMPLWARADIDMI